MGAGACKASGVLWEGGGETGSGLLLQQVLVFGMGSVGWWWW